jgi:hypothetical protein
MITLHELSTSSDYELKKSDKEEYFAILLIKILEYAWYNRHQSVSHSHGRLFRIFGINERRSIYGTNYVLTNIMFLDIIRRSVSLKHRSVYI